MLLNNSSPVQIFEQNLEVLCQAGHENRVDDKFENVVSCAEVISRISPEGSKKLENDVMRYLQSTRLGNDDYFQHLSSLRSCKEVID